MSVASRSPLPTQMARLRSLGVLRTMQKSVAGKSAFAFRECVQSGNEQQRKSRMAHRAQN